jgi:hypothetical protein
MSYYNLCGTGSQHSNISKGGAGEGVHIKITGMKDSNSQGRQIKIWHWIDVFKVIMNKKNPEQISSDIVFTKFGQGNFSGVVKQCFN